MMVTTKTDNVVEKMNKENQIRGKRLRSLVKTYYDMQETRQAMNSRLRHFDSDQEKNELHHVASESQKLEDRLEDEMENELQNYEFYTDYLSRLRGLGTKMGGCIMSELALPRRFERIEDRDGRPRVHENVIEETDDGWMVESPPSFQVAGKVSQLWSYCGYGDPDNKRKKGESLSHNTFIKEKIHILSENFRRNGSKYYEYYSDAKEYYTENRDWSNAHCDMAALRIIKKLFLSHAWEVWRTWNNYDCPEPYVFDKMGHTGYIEPFIEVNGDVQLVI